MSEKKEYIERGALIAFVRGVRQRLPKDSKYFFTRDEMLLNFQQCVDAQPAADVESARKNGEWKFEHFSTPQNAFEYYECSICKSRSKTTDNYCFYCGAHMERSGSGE